MRSGSSIGSEASRTAASRARRRSKAPSWSTPGPPTALTVRWTSAPSRCSDSSGNTMRAGGNEDQLGSAPPLSAKAKPPVHTGPAPAGSASWPLEMRSRPIARQPCATSSKRPGPRETTSCAVPIAASAKPRSGCSQQNQRSPASRASKARALGSMPAAGAVALTRVRRSRSATSSRPSATPASRPSVSSTTVTESGPTLLPGLRWRTSRRRGRSRSRPCAPSRPGRAGGSSARRPRPSRPSR